MSQPLLSQLFTDGVLVDLSVTFWTAIRRNTAEDLGITHEVPDFVVGFGTKRLIPKERVEEWKRYANRAMYVIFTDSFDFPIRSARFIPAEKLQKVEAQLQEIKREFEVSVASFLKDYEAIRADVLERYAEHRENLEHCFPSRGEVATKFSFGWTVYTMSVPKKMRMQQLDRERQRQEEEAMTAYQEKLEQQAGEFLAGAITSLRARTVEICQSLSERITRGEIITESSLKMVRNYIDKFKSMNFAGDHAMEAALETLKQQSLNGFSAADFKTDEDARKALLEALQETKKVADQITDVDKVTKTYRRRITI